MIEFGCYKSMKDSLDGGRGRDSPQWNYHAERVNSQGQYDLKSIGAIDARSKEMLARRIDELAGSGDFNLHPRMPSSSYEKGRATIVGDSVTIVVPLSGDELESVGSHIAHIRRLKNE